MRFRRSVSRRTIASRDDNIFEAPIIFIVRVLLHGWSAGSAGPPDSTSAGVYATAASDHGNELFHLEHQSTPQAQSV